MEKPIKLDKNIVLKYILENFAEGDKLTWEDNWIYWKNSTNCLLAQYNTLNNDFYRI